jgi:hypothetical protein
VQYGRGFFRSIRSYFRQQYTGRYFSVILAELARFEPQAFAKIILAAGIKLPKTHLQSLRTGEFTINLEWWFPGKKRRADLALYLSPEKPILLLEIKDEDGRPPNANRVAQLNDYVRFVELKKREALEPEDCTHFLLLSRYIPTDDDARVLQKAKAKKLPVGELRHGQILNILAGSGNTITRMVLEYLEDVGMTYRQVNLKQDRKPLMYMATRLLGCPSQFGRTSGAPSIEALPKLMEIFFGNLAVLGDWVRSKNRTVIPLRFRRHLLIEPDYDLPKRTFRMNADNMKHEERVASIVEKLEVTGGTVWLYSEATFQCPKIGQWAGFDFGYWYWLAKGEQPEVGLYVNFWWQGRNKELEDRPDQDSPYWESDNLKKFPDENESERLLRSGFSKAWQLAKKRAPPPYDKVFAEFRLP